ncbi:MAG: hypothetical protein ACI4NE_00070 [Succinivibrio sp.]
MCTRKRSPKLPTIAEMLKIDPALRGQKGHLLIQNNIFSTTEKIDAFSNINLCPFPMITIASEVYQFLTELISDGTSCVFINDNGTVYTVAVKYYPKEMRDGFVLNKLDDNLINFITDFATITKPKKRTAAKKDSASPRKKVAKPKTSKSALEKIAS